MWAQLIPETKRLRLFFFLVARNDDDNDDIWYFIEIWGERELNARVLSSRKGDVRIIFTQRHVSIFSGRICRVRSFNRAARNSLCLLKVCSLAQWDPATGGFCSWPFLGLLFVWAQIDRLLSRAKRVDCARVRWAVRAMLINIGTIAAGSLTRTKLSALVDFFLRNPCLLKHDLGLGWGWETDETIHWFTPWVARFSEFYKKKGSF